MDSRAHLCRRDEAEDDAADQVGVSLCEQHPVSQTPAQAEEYGQRETDQHLPLQGRFVGATQQQQEHRSEVKDSRKKSTACVFFSCSYLLSLGSILQVVIAVSTNRTAL